MVVEVVVVVVLIFLDISVNNSAIYSTSTFFSDFSCFDKRFSLLDFIPLIMLPISALASSKKIATSLCLVLDIFLQNLHISDFIIL